MTTPPLPGADPAHSALLTDLYQLTMALGYWRSGRAEREAAFHLYFRTAPFGGGYAVACGIEPALAYLEALRFDDADLTYLASLHGADGTTLFPPDFLDALSKLRLTLDVDVVPEGTVVFPTEPLVRVRGPLLQAQLVETALLVHVGFPTLVATKAARLCLAAGGDPVVEFGLRRAQGPDGGLSATRASYVGGCAATSHVLAGQRFGIPVRGTHAHSWVMAFDDERQAFDAYARALPNNVVLLVDTYDTLDGVRNAITTGLRLRAEGHRLDAIRLDSGDLAYLSRQARRMLDEAGLTDVAIMATNDLDETVITSLKQQGAPITIWGVGTRLATAYDQPALGAVYKLTAMRDDAGAWSPRVKVSEQAAKTTIPGLLQVRRYRVQDGDPGEVGQFAADMLVDEHAPPPDGDTVMVDPLDPTRRRRFAAGTPWEPLLVPALQAGKRVRDAESLDAARVRARSQLAGFHGGIKRLVNPHRHPVGLELGLHERRTALVMEMRGAPGAA
ncbi:nicotinate phosphoribosyltransferase [Roseisolibacter agri]|uniref:Nicotinate phosphoribosyltransferase n=1 Tax=Roseisolibacter agri TaxID=2014610 RepID=A0AA37V4E9_9BACT|nr:nicotinate phosphoribosyltransferase [Roseisolibacter agri]GLC27852.1 nicotinate phosphoribosyltransferase [Roseisolibacter agri]